MVFVKTQNGESSFKFLLLLGFVYAVYLSATIYSYKSSCYSSTQEEQFQWRISADFDQDEHDLEKEKEIIIPVSLDDQEESSITADLDKESFKKKEKIIIPVNLYGPNNQIEGLREGLFLSRLMNLSFVSPPFFRHHTTGGHYSLEPDGYIDLDNLSRMD